MEKNSPIIKQSSSTITPLKDDTKAISTGQSDEIDLLEVYVEKSRAIGLGQRLLWHLDKFNKKISLPYISGARDFYLQPICVKLKGQNAASYSHDEVMYTSESNTVFYYNDYKVVLLLDFSQSTTAIYPGQSKSYINNMRESLEVVISNLLFQIPNKFWEDKNLKKKHPSSPSKKETQDKLPKSRNVKGFLERVELEGREVDDSNDESDFVQKNDLFSAIEEQSESGANNNPLTPAAKEQQNQFDSDQDRAGFQRKKHNHESRPSYTPKVYLSIVVSGLPPGNNIKLIVHNQKLDVRDICDLLMSIESKLLKIENELRNNLKKPKIQDDDGIDGSLQVHLENAQYILDLMSQDAKPLLIFFTDSANSLLGIHRRNQNLRKPGTQSERRFQDQFGQIDQSIHKLHLSDTRIISIDLQNENKTCNSFGFVNHENELQYLTNITQGMHFTFQRLIEINENAQLGGRYAEQNPLHLNQLLSRDQTVRFLQQPNLVIENNLRRSLSSQPHQEDGLKQKKQNLGGFKIPTINTLQKLMFARPCNNRLFLKSDEVAKVLKGSNNVNQIQVHHERSNFGDLSLSELLFNNKFVPLLQCRHLADYQIDSVSFAILCEFRSKMGFKFLGAEFTDLSLKKNNFGQEQKQAIKAIHQLSYEYFIDSHIQVRCTLTADQKQNSVSVRYNLHAPTSIMKDLKQQQNDTIYDRCQNFVSSIHARDKHFQILEQIVQILQKVQILFANPSQFKYRDINRQRQKKFHEGLFVLPYGVASQSKDSDSLKDEMQKNEADLAKKKVKKIKRETLLLTEDAAKEYLFKTKDIWDRLYSVIGLKCHIYQWKCYFRYSMVTIVTQSACVLAEMQLKRDSSSEVFWSRTIDEQWQIESKIETTLVNDISEFTSFTLDNQTFVQVFEENTNLNQYRLIDTGLGNSSSIMDMKDQDDNSYLGGKTELVFGFCLIRLNWVATNIAECHFGFYQVGAKQRLNFVQSFQKYINQKCQQGFQLKDCNDKNEQLAYSCYKKNIASILLRTPKRFRLSLKSLQKKSEQAELPRDSPQETELDPKLIPVDRLLFTSQQKPDLVRRRVQFLMSGLESEATQLFYKKDWRWNCFNEKTNRELFFKILDQRLRDGFQIVNRFQGQVYFFHLVKILRTNKDRQLVKNPRKSQKSNYSEEFRKEPKKKTEKVDFVIQFLIFMKEDSNNSDKVTLFSELYMEQETSFFQLNKSLEKHGTQSNRSSFQISSSGSNDGSHNPVSSCKEFFNQTVKYIETVDTYLCTQLNTYHHVLKNAVIKQTQESELPQRQWSPTKVNQNYKAIKEQVCYFKNILANTKRQRKQREIEIQQKMESLHREWKQHLVDRYPDLFSKEGKPETTIILDVQLLLETGHVFASHKLKVPQQDTNDPHAQKEICAKFQHSINLLLSSFADLKVAAEVCNDTLSDVYFKLISKQILMMIKVPCQQQMLSQLEKNGFIQVTYLRFDNRLIFVPQRYQNDPIKKYFASQKNVDPAKKQSKFSIQVQGKQVSGFKQVRSNHNFLPLKTKFLAESDNSEQNLLETPTRNRTSSQGIFEAPKHRMSVHLDDVRQFQTSEKASFDPQLSDEIHQIDQTKELYLLFQQQHQRSRKFVNQLQFETKVSVILQNFTEYLSKSFEKVFAEIVLNGFQRHDSHHKQAQIRADDFKTALNTMGKITFQIDLSFAYLMHSYLDQNIHREKIGLLDDASDIILSEIVTRNFVQCPVDSSMFIYKDNPEDNNQLERSNSTEHNSQGIDAQIPTPDLQTHKSALINGEYRPNLEGTADAYSDSEKEEAERPERAQKKLDYREIYSLCKKLLLKIELVITDKNGNQVIRQPTGKYSDVFKMAHKIPNLAKGLQQKVAAQKEMKDTPLDQEINLSMFEQIDSLSERSSEQDLSSKASVEVWVTFYTTPQYMGLLRAKDAEFLQEKSELVLNDDLMEDLKRVCQLSSGIPNERDKQRVQMMPPFFDKNMHLQIIKTIPYYFQQINHTADKLTQFKERAEFSSDNLRVFYFEEIQRKIIYGFLRRFYALMAENILEVVALYRPISAISFILLQKYFGYLLFNQRQHYRVTLFQKKLLKRFKGLNEVLRQEIENCQTVDVGVYFDEETNQRFYYLKNSVHNGNRFELKLDDQWQVAIDRSAQDLVIPFWCFFAIQETELTIDFNFTFRLPRFKENPATITPEIITAYLFQMKNNLIVKVMKLLLLQEVNEKNQWSKELKLAETQVDQIAQQKSDSPRGATQTVAPPQFQQNEQNLKAPAVAGKVSKFQKGLMKFSGNLTPQGTGTAQVEQSLSKPASTETLGFTKGKSPPEDSGSYYVLENFPTASKIFYTSHSLNADQTLLAIQEAFKLANTIIEDRPNWYIVEHQQKINLIRLSTVSNDAVKMEIQGVSIPSELQIHMLSQRIQQIIVETTMKKIANEALLRGGNLTQDDLDYIQTSDEKIIMHFPIVDSVKDKMMLLKILSQNMSRRFLMPIRITKGKHNIAPNSTANSFVQSSFASQFTKSFGHTSSQFVENFQIEPSQGEKKLSADSSTVRLSENENLLLYNFRLSLDRQIESPVGAFLGQSLALVQPCVLSSSFNAESFASKVSTLDQDKILKEQSEFIQDTFEVSPCKFDERMNKICKSYREKGSSPIMSYSKAEQNDFKTAGYSLPRVYKTQKDKNDVLQQKKEFKLQEINHDSLSFDQRANCKADETAFWLQIVVSRRGQLNSDLFIKYVTLCVNQSIQDALIEMLMYSQIPSSLSEGDYKQSSFQDFRTLLDRSISTHAVAQRSYKFDLFGISSEIYQDTSFSLVEQIHNFFFCEVSQHASSLQICTKDRFELLQNIIGFQLLIQVLDQRNLVAKILVLIPVQVPLNKNTVFKIIKQHTQRHQTNMKNLQVEFTVFVGTCPPLFRIQTEEEGLILIDLVHQEAQNQLGQNLDSKFSSPTSLQEHRTENEEEIKTMETGLSSINNLKSFCSSITTINLLETGQNARYFSHRSFFAIIDLSSKNLSLKTYNVKLEKAKHLKLICKNNAVWLTTRQEQLRRCLAQRMGLVYALPDFYDNFNIIKTSSNVQQLNNTQDIYYSRAFKLVQCNPVSSQMQNQLKNVEVRKSKSKKGKKKKRKVVSNAPSAVEFKESDFFSSYIDQMFKDEQSLKKLNSIEEFNRAGTVTKGPLQYSNDFQQQLQIKLQTGRQNANRRFGAALIAKQQYEEQQNPKNLYHLKASNSENLRASVSGQTGLQSLKSFAQPGFNLGQPVQVSQLGKQSQAVQFKDLLQNKTILASFSNISLTKHKVNSLDVYLFSSVVVNDIQSELFKLRVKTSPSNSQASYLNTLKSIGQEVYWNVKHIFDHMHFIQMMAVLAYNSQKNKLGTAKGIEDEYNQENKTLVERMAIGVIKNNRSISAQSQFILTLQKARLVYNGQTIRLFNQATPESSPIQTMLDHTLSQGEVQSIRAYYDNFCAQVKKKLQIQQYFSDILKIEANMRNTVNGDDSFLGNISQNIDESALEKIASRQTYIASSPALFDNFNSPVKQKTDLLEIPQHQTRFAVKQDGYNRLFMYVIRIVNDCLELQVYLFEDIQNSIHPQIGQLLRLPPTQPDFAKELDLSSKFKTASFYYDFHLLTIVDQIKQKKVGLNISLLLCHLLHAFRKPPSQATNFVKQVKIRLKISPILDAGALLNCFFRNSKEYGFEKTEIAPGTTAIYQESKANESDQRKAELNGGKQQDESNILRNYFRLFLIEKEQPTLHTQKLYPSERFLYCRNKNLGAVASDSDNQNMVVFVLYIIYVKESVKAANTGYKHDGQEAEEMKKVTGKLKIDKHNYPEKLQVKFEQCSEDFYREQKWLQFFVYLSTEIPPSVIPDIIKLSFKFNLKHMPQIKLLVEPRKYTVELTFFYLSQVFKGRFYIFGERAVSGRIAGNSIMIFQDPQKVQKSKQTFMLLVEVDAAAKSIQIQLLRRQRHSQDNQLVELKSEERTLVMELASVLSNILWRIASN